MQHNQGFWQILLLPLLKTHAGSLIFQVNSPTEITTVTQYLGHL